MPLFGFFKYAAIVLIVSTLASCRQTAAQQQPAADTSVSPAHRITFPDAASMQAFFRHKAGRQPLLSAHRGGPTPGYPENCLETFEHTLALHPAVLEVDVRQTSDGQFILMHDRSLDRTTNGTGKVSERDLRYIKSLQLRDNDGNLTPYKVPTLEEALHWAKDNTVLMLDVKGELDREKLLSILQAYRSQHYTIIIPNGGFEFAEWYHEHDSLLLVSLSTRSLTEWERAKEYHLDFRRVIGWVGTSRPDSALIDTLHARSILVNIGTLGNIDQQAAARGPQVYLDLHALGVDMFATDYPERVGNILLSAGAKAN